MKSINDIDTASEEGRLLFAAIVIITTESRKDKTPDQVLSSIEDLALDMYATQDLNDKMKEKQLFSKQKQQYFETFEKNVLKNIDVLECCIDNKIEKITIGKKLMSCFLFLNRRRKFTYKLKVKK
jgi:transcription termination factor NusB